MVWLENDGLLGFLLKSIVSLWASKGLLFVGRPVEARAAFIFQISCNYFVKARLKARCIKALKTQMVCSKMTGFWASYLNLLFNHGLPTGFSL